MEKPTIYYVDGAFNGNTGIGGYAVIPINDKGEIEHRDILSVGNYGLSSMAMELEAAIAAIRRAPTTSPVTIYSDSQTIVDVAERKSIKSFGQIPRLWKTFLRLINERTNISICWVKGHDCVPGNECADRAARNAAREFARSCRDCPRNARAMAPAVNDAVRCAA